MADQLQQGEASGPGKLGQALLFLANFVKHPLKVGWFLPSSRFLVDDVLQPIKWEEAKVIVEYGPGTGTFTTRILERMRPDAKLIAVEINPEFCKFLSQSVTDPRFHLVKESAAEIDSILECLGFSEADYVISGIPFTTLPHDLRDSIVRKTYSVLRPEGKFLVYQVSSAVVPYLERVFGNVSRSVQFLNIVPAQVFSCARS
jgi:phospholipid N-methyltransferase